MAERKSRGILGDTDPDKDADVIMTAAVVGYAHKRLSEKKNCAFAAEAAEEDKTNLIFPKNLTLPTKIDNYKAWVKECEPETMRYLKEVEEFQKSVSDIDKLRYIANEEVGFVRGGILLENAIVRINGALQYLKENEGEQVVVDFTPNFGEAGVIWIVGGTGDLSLENHNRYVNSPNRSYSCAKIIGYIDSKEFAGYRGPGAYTGMSARQEGNSYIYSTFRANPSADSGNRWVPSDPSIMGYAIKDGDSRDKGVRYVSVWGIIGDNAIADKTKNEYQMVYLDPEQDKSRFEKYVVGYTHGMIQAIYDVRQVEIDRILENHPNELFSGTAYEIGLTGKREGLPSTTKMASCFYCAMFMEANEKPASSIHLGSGESWAPAYVSKELIDANQLINAKNANFSSRNMDRSITNCNFKWAKYCADILASGAGIIEQSRMLEEDHQESISALKEYLRRDDRKTAANLILDSATVHQKIAVRIVNTLKLPDK